jgi:hypothetical protein
LSKSWGRYDPIREEYSDLAAAVVQLAQLISTDLVASVDSCRT